MATQKQNAKFRDLQAKEKRTPIEQAQFAALSQPSPTQERLNQQAGQDYIKEREKLKSLGASKDQAAIQANLNQQGKFTDAYIPGLAAQNQAFIEQLNADAKRTQSLATPDIAPENATTAAGYSAIGSVVNKIGGIFGANVDVNPNQLVEQGKTGGILGKGANVVATAIGTAGNINIPVIGKAFSIFGTEKATVDNLVRSAKQSKIASNTVLRNVKNGGDLDEAINQMQQIEQNLRLNYDQAIVKMRGSPQDVAEGLDLTSDMAVDVSYVQQKRDILLRAKLTGNFNEVLASTNSLDLQDASQGLA